MLLFADIIYEIIVSNTGDIGYFNIIGESAVAAGIRRIECLTGNGAENYVDDVEAKLHSACDLLKTNVNDLNARINNLLNEKKKLEQEVFNLKKGLTQELAKKIVADINTIFFSTTTKKDESEETEEDDE